MKLGAVFPQTEIGRDPSAVRDFAQTVEGLGFDHLLAYDHVLGASHDREPKLTGPYTEDSLFHEVFVLFGYLAAATARIELVTGVLILPQRQTALVAKQAAEVDVLSGGRLRLGVGVGWNYVEYEALGERFDNRGARQEEQVSLLRKLWRERLLDYRGDYHRIDRAGLLPLPEREIPIWFGGFVSTAYERAARLGDGFIYGVRTVALQALEETRGHLRAAGRDPAGFGAELLISDILADPADWVAQAQEWQAVGGTHVSLITMGAGFEEPKQHLAALTRFRAAMQDAGIGS